MSRYIISLIVITSFSNLFSQNIEISGINKIYYYKTIADFFNNKKDSIAGENLVYKYGKVSYTDKKSSKKIKFHLHKDSSIFAFKIDRGINSPIYAISKGEKRYGVFMGGTKDLFFVFYSGGNLYNACYDKENYIIGYNGKINEFGYYLVFTKRDFESKKNGDVEYFIKDKGELYDKYIAEKENSTTYNWVKNYISIQIKYVREYNN